MDILKDCPAEGQDIEEEKSVKHCTTAAGAIDTFVKGLIDEDEQYLKAASGDVSEDLVREASEFVIHHGFSDYSIINLKEEEPQVADYTAIIEIRGETKGDDGELSSHEETDVLLIPVKLIKIKNWYVSENGDTDAGHESVCKMRLPYLNIVSKNCEDGAVFVKLFSRTTVKGSSSYEANYNAEFEHTRWNYRADLKRGIVDGSLPGVYSFGVACGLVYDLNEEPEWKAKENEYLMESMAKGSGWGYREKSIGVSWDGNLETETGQFGQKPYESHEGIAVYIYENDKLKEEIRIERGEFL